MAWEFKWGDATCGPGLPFDLENFGLISIPYRGYREGFIVTVKDATNLYVSGGMLEVASNVITLSAQATVPMGTTAPSTLYKVYASWASSSLVFTISVTVQVFSHSLGAEYMTGDSTKRWIGDVKTAA